MSEVLAQVDPVRVLARAQAAVDELLGLELSGLDDDALLGFWRELERLRRRVPAVEHGLVLEAQGRGLAESVQLRSVAQLLRWLLRVEPGEAAARVRAAGELSERQARVIVQTLDRLPAAAHAEHGEQVEAELVAFADRFDAVNLAKLAERMLAYYDPDGRLAEVEHRERHRELTVAQRVDGSSRLSGELTAEATELLLLHLDAFARPKPAPGPCPRSPGSPPPSCSP